MLSIKDSGNDLLIIYRTTPDSTKPGKQPRSFRFHPAKISLNHALPKSSITKYSILCEAIPSNTVIKVFIFLITISNDFFTFFSNFSLSIETFLQIYEKGERKNPIVSFINDCLNFLSHYPSLFIQKIYSTDCFWNWICFYTSIAIVPNRVNNF